MSISTDSPVFMWHYRQDEQTVGPFDRKTLDKLHAAGVINDETLIINSEVQQWIPFMENFAQEMSAQAAPHISIDRAETLPPPLPFSPSQAMPPPIPSVSTEPTPPSEKAEALSYYYLDANRQPIGPVSINDLSQLMVEGIISSTSMISRKGDAEWIPVSQLLGIPKQSIPPSSKMASAVGSGNPRLLKFEQFVLMMGITLTFYIVYLVPSYSRDMKAITKRPRMEFQPLLILGILSLGLLLSIMMVLWAYDLEKHGKAVRTTGRQESLGTHVLILNILSFVIALFSGGLAIVVSMVIGSAAVWMLQKEINLYAQPE